MADRSRLAGRGAVLSAGAILLVGGAGWAAYGSNLLRTHPARAAVPAIATTTAPVVRTNVLQQTTVTGTLGHTGSYTVAAAGTTAGVITWLPATSRRLGRGQPVYEVNGQAVRLFYGARPAWRDMGLGITDGPDVLQLKRNLAALGYGSGLVLDGHFDAATAWAVQRWQQARGLPVTGTVPLGQLVFLPGPLLVTSLLATVGGAVAAGTPILQGTGTAADVQLQLDPNAAPSIRPGNRVIVTLPDGTTDPGVVTAVSRVAANPPPAAGQQAQPQPVIPVTVRLLHPVRGELDQAQVQVAITTAEDRGVLAVPVTALLARPGGQFAVMVVTGAQQRIVPVRTGLFDQTAGLVELSGPGLAAGQRVQVPSP